MRVIIRLHDDIAALTNIPVTTLQTLENLAEKSIAHQIFESLKEGNNQCNFDIGIGKLSVYQDENYVQYKFIPSNTLQEYVAKSCDFESPLIEDAENAIERKIYNTYKELFSNG